MFIDELVDYQLKNYNNEFKKTNKEKEVILASGPHFDENMSIVDTIITQIEHFNI